MNEDIVSLLQDLGKELSVDVIAQFIIRNPEVEDLIAAKMGALLSTDQPPTSGSGVPNQPPASQNQSSTTASLSLVQAGLSYISGIIPLKMIFVVNMELSMGRGKQCAQVAHAALGLYLKIQESTNQEQQHKLYQWISMGQKKIVVKGQDLKQLLSIQEMANQARIPNLIISDAGCTQIAPGSRTVLSLFGTDEELDKITGHLKLL